jgi:2-polyprenyl-3-methyl-5-hydroxy-6-metoxy-1,4-benzoquinol methylase
MTAWDNIKICEHILATNFPKLKDSNHFSSLKSCFELPTDCKTVLDVGCCKAELAETFPQFDYTGADLEHIIENVSKALRPSLKYIHFDANSDNYSFMGNYDIIVMNSFLSEMANGIEILNKVLEHAKKYVIIHRQDIENKTTTVNYQTYGGMNTVNFIISREDINKITSRHDCKIIFETQSFLDHPEKRSLTISK